MDAVKQAIISASPDYYRGGTYQTWEYVQQQLRNGSFYWGGVSKVIRCVHMFYREFRKGNEAEGKITQLIFLVDFQNQMSKGDFLFEKVGRYANWNECVHPMYYNHGGGGFHHSVIGMGVSMYSAVAFRNRLLCNLADKAMMPKLMLKPTSEEAFESACAPTVWRPFDSRSQRGGSANPHLWNDGGRVGL